MAERSTAAVAAALALTERITSTCVDALIEWGDAINRAEEATDPQRKEALTTMARAAGLECARLGVGLAKHLGGRRG